MRRPQRSFVALAVATSFTTSCLPAYAAPGQNQAPFVGSHCELRHSAAFVKNWASVPPLIRSDLLRRVGKIAVGSEEFQETDVGSLKPLPTRKFIGGLRSGGYFFVWYWHGGRGLETHVVAYLEGLIDGFGRPATEVDLADHLGSQSPCIATDAILDGVYQPTHF